MKILLLHPGEMGVSLGASLREAGHEVFWLRQGRSPATVERASKVDLVAINTMTEGVSAVETVFSVCPPGAALVLAKEVAEAGFKGTYVDANAVAPATVQQIAGVVGDGLVDGGIIGPPAWHKGTTRLYLSGGGAARVAALFQDSLMQAHVCGGEAGSASALKMAYAAYTKGSSALILAVRALAEFHGVSESLLAEWDISQPELKVRSERAALGTSRKAWRFEGEMHEIAETFRGAGLPHQFHEGAAALYGAMADLKDQEPADIDRVMRVLLGQQR